MLRGPSLQQKLIHLLRVLPAVTVQNRLMSAADRDLALAMLHMTDTDRELFFAGMSKAKESRVREELSRHEHTRIQKSHYESALNTLVRHMSSERPIQGARSYYRPTRTPRRR